MPPPMFIVNRCHFNANMQQNKVSGKIFFRFIEIDRMQIQHKEAGNHGMFFIEKDGDIVAEIVYAKGSDNIIIIEHTEVDDSLQGMNIGYELVHKTVDYARMYGLKISPVCPFACSVFEKKADFKDVLV